MITASITNTLITAEISAGEITANVTNNLITAEVGNSTTTYVYGSSDIPSGSTTGDFVRWNQSTLAWEVAHEPINFKQIVLTPLSAAVSDIEGGLWYKSTEKAVFVCADI